MWIQQWHESRPFSTNPPTPDSCISGGESRIFSKKMWNRVYESPTLTFLNVIPIQAPFKGRFIAEDKPTDLRP